MAAYYRPRTLREALDIRAGGPVAVLAGGTDLYPARTARAGWGDMRHPDVLDISAIDSLRGIAVTEKHVRFGALATWTDLVRAMLPPAFAGYQAAAREVGGLQIQNRGTLAGNICTASPAGDGIPCLLTLDTEVELCSLAGQRTLPVANFVDGYRHTQIRPDELVTAIIIPSPPAGARGRFEKLGARRYLVISIVMAAAVVAAEDGVVTEARVAVGACTAVAARLPALEAALTGAPLASLAELVEPAHLAGLAPIDDIRASGEFRRSAACDVVRDLLAGFAAGAERRAA